VPAADASAALARVVAALPRGGEARTGQDEMARAVADAIDSGRHLVVRAGTGTGKTLGYLVRMLSTYLNALIRSGFVLEAVEEPRAAPLLARQRPLYTEVPIFFACRASRGRG
jgi:ATP-dependent DNA helicase DinG